MIEISINGFDQELKREREREYHTKDSFLDSDNYKWGGR